MRAAILFVLASFVSSCGGATLDSPEARYEVHRGWIVDDGYAIRASLSFRVTNGARPQAFAWDLKVVWNDKPPALSGGPCDAYEGFALEAPLLAPLSLGANESREVSVVASGERFLACDPSQFAARCGEPVTVLAIPHVVEGPSPWIATTVDCSIPLAGP